MTVLDLDAVAPPAPPSHSTTTTITVRLARPLALWVEQQAERAQITHTAWLRELIERTRRRSADMPADVRDWLLVQAGQCGTPGDVDATVVALVRHLAARWPNGGRLR